MNEIKERLQNILSNDISKIVISKPRLKSAPFKKIELEKRQGAFHVSKYTEKQVFHERAQSPAEYCTDLLTEYMQLNAWDSSREFMITLTKKGAASYKVKAAENAPKVRESHNREKQYIIREGTVVPPLVDMGIFTKDGKVVSSMQDKFRQINRFIELIDDAVKKSTLKSFNIIDFGCGKSYLTFILYYYFAEIKKLPVNIVGLDLKADVIEKCNAAAKKYGYNNLSFKLGDIKDYDSEFTVDMVISLHACDTATDYALYNAVKWNAKMIFSVPCCQHELNGQIKGGELELLTRYGIIKERFSALATDSIRGALLEAQGYNVQLLEFVDLSHTPKNILIRAVKKNKSSEAAKQEAEKLMEAFSFKPTLYSLFYPLGEKE